jgi:hypothetical protein
MNTSSFGIEKATLIRMPATANLMLDSADRDSKASLPWNFSITRRNQLINGYFTRAGTTEVVLEWCEGNIYTKTASLPGNSALTLDISGASVRETDEIVQLVLGGFYTVAEALESIRTVVNDLSGTTGVSVNVVTGQGIPFLAVTGGHLLFNSDSGGLAEALGITPLDEDATAFFIRCPDLRKYRYLDFVSPQLTSVQDVKDAATNAFVRDVLCRWYMAEDEPEQLDQYGFPILMGYKQFVRRRIFNPPKQIKWEQNFPVGNLSFEVYGNDGAIVSSLNIDGTVATSTDSNWLMTLQLSEG